MGIFEEDRLDCKNYEGINEEFAEYWYLQQAVVVLIAILALLIIFGL